jgi:hypothetical protein
LESLLAEKRVRVISAVLFVHTKRRRIMRQLRLEDRYELDDYYEFVPTRTFYHYFPYLFAISESDTKLFFEESQPNKVFVDWQELYYANDDIQHMKKVWIAPYKKSATMDTVLYDNNFIFNLKETLGIKNFRANLKKFERDHPEFLFKEADTSNALLVIKDWYERRGAQPDFGYVLWFAKNLNLFKDIHSNIGVIKEKPVAFSLWGELDDETAVHIISKDRGIPYLQDYMRSLTYEDMTKKGFTMVNDGGDIGDAGLYQYKLKLRPKFIIPIYSWTSKQNGT